MVKISSSTDPISLPISDVTSSNDNLNSQFSDLYNTEENNDFRECVSQIDDDNGLPIFKSSTNSLWPILCLLKNSGLCPFPIAVYFSKSKLTSLDDYNEDFVSEMTILEWTGFRKNKKYYSIKLKAFICDTSAQAFIKCIKPHNSYNFCKRCVQTGELVGKVVMPNRFTGLQTDSDF
nr:uncharacterized protein LOC124819128 [Hydra vulgaris]